jgi:putative transposase
MLSRKQQYVTRARHSHARISMVNAGTPNHSKWDCTYHVVFIPKFQREILYRQLRRCLGEVLRGLTEQKECQIEVGHLLPGHVRVTISIPPKYAVSLVVGFINCNRAVHLAGVTGPLCLVQC